MSPHGPSTHQSSTMKRFISALALLSGGLIFWPAAANTETPDPTDPSVLAERGIEVLARGPVHEAYAEPYNGKPEAMPVIPKGPPKQVDEVPPDQKPEGDDVQWIPGYWSWDDERKDHIWVSGFWRKPPPGRRWITGTWKMSGEGWQWTPGMWVDAGRQDMQYLPEPPSSLESGPSVPAPSEDYQYVPGNWLYRDYGYVWRPGFWITGRPGWVWNPARYYWNSSGYCYNDGYWDYPLEDRGLLFAPVWFNQPVFRRWGYSYCPSYFWRPGFLLDCLFVRNGFNNYWCGDYYGGFYRGCGFAPFFSLTFFNSNRHCDPHYNYNRWNNRHDRDWDRRVADRHDRRERGDLARPPRTLVDQNTVVNNIQNINVKGKNNQVNATIANQVAQNGKDSVIDQATVLTSLNKAKDKGGRDRDGPRLQSISNQEREVAKLSGQELQRLGKERERREGEVLKANAGNLPKIDRPAKIDLPQTANKGKGAGKTIAAPPPVTNDGKVTRFEPKGNGNSGAKFDSPGKGLPSRFDDARNDSSNKNNPPKLRSDSSSKPEPRFDGPGGNNKGNILPKGNAGGSAPKTDFGGGKATMPKVDFGGGKSSAPKANPLPKTDFGGGGKATPPKVDFGGGGKGNPGGGGAPKLNVPSFQPKANPGGGGGAPKVNVPSLQPKANPGGGGGAPKLNAPSFQPKANPGGGGGAPRIQSGGGGGGGAPRIQSGGGGGAAAQLPVWRWWRWRWRAFRPPAPAERPENVGAFGWWSIRAVPAGGFPRWWRRRWPAAITN